MRRGLKRRNLTGRRLHKPTIRPRRAFWHKSSAQAIIEYTILFAVIAAVTFIGTAVFFQRVCRSEGGRTPVLKRYFNKVVREIK